MPDWREQFSSPSFWIVAAVTGLVFSTLANYITRLLDRSWLYGARRASRRQQKREAERSALERFLAAHPVNRFAHAEHAKSVRDVGLAMMIGSIPAIVFALVLPSPGWRIIVLALGALSLVVGYVAVMRGFDMTGPLIEACRIVALRSLDARNKAMGPPEEEYPALAQLSPSPIDPTVTDRSPAAQRGVAAAE